MPIHLRLIIQSVCLFVLMMVLVQFTCQEQPRSHLPNQFRCAFLSSVCMVYEVLVFHALNDCKEVPIDSPHILKKIDNGYGKNGCFLATFLPVL